jgi:sugar phosphate isomerase/epimerase
VTELGIFARTFSRPTLEETFDAVRDTGLHAMQFNLALAGGASADRIRAAAVQRGLRMVAVSGTYNMAHPDPSVRADGARRLAETIAAASALGTDTVTLSTGTRDRDDMWRRHPDNATSEAWADMRAGVEAALAHAEAHRVTLAFEPEHNNVVDSAANGRRLLDEIGSPRLKVVIDPANLTGEPLREAFELLGADIVLAHAKDVRADGEIVAAGRGELDYELYLAVLSQQAPQAPLILHGLAEDEVPGSIAFLRAAVSAAAARA